MAEEHQTGGHLVLNPNYEKEAAEFFRTFAIPEEDRRRFTTAPQAFRWWGCAQNVIPIEKYRRS
jgi:hypothetical protein